MTAYLKSWGLALLLGAVSLAHAQEGRNVSQYNLRNGLGLQGHDPVAVFEEGGGRALAGSTEFRVIHEGVTYFFASEANLTLFVADPEKYEPTYGGWCAYAMASGAKVPIQPTLFTIHGRRAHYFVSPTAKRSFDRDVALYEGRADGHWLRLAGESARN